LTNRDEYNDRPAEDPDKLRREIREKGARVAYAALVGVCLDPKSPAPAKATAGTTILRVGGYLEQVGAPADGLDAVSEAELKALIARLKEHKAALDEKDARDAAKQPTEARKSPRKGERGRPIRLKRL